MELETIGNEAFRECREQPGTEPLAVARLRMTSATSKGGWCTVAQRSGGNDSSGLSTPAMSLCVTWV